MVDIKTRSLLEVVTADILTRPVPRRFIEPTPQAINKAYKWISARIEYLFLDRGIIDVRREHLEELTGFMHSNRVFHWAVLRNSNSPEQDISTLLHFLGHIKVGSVNMYSVGEGSQTVLEPSNRRKFDAESLKKEFAVDDAIRSVVLSHPGIQRSDAIARALWRSYLPFTQAKP